MDIRISVLQGYLSLTYAGSAAQYASPSPQGTPEHYNGSLSGWWGASAPHRWLRWQQLAGHSPGARQVFASPLPRLTRIAGLLLSAFSPTVGQDASQVTVPALWSFAEQRGKREANSAPVFVKSLRLAAAEPAPVHWSEPPAL
jgi:hypothetical protein